MGYMAEVADGVVQRVVVADSAAWCVEHLGGEWVETSDPYAPATAVSYAGPGQGYDGEWSCRFAERWVQPQPGVEDREPYPAGAVRWHDGHLWVSMVRDNVWVPGQSAWRRAPTAPGVPPAWTQPTGAHDAWGLGEHVTFAGEVYHSIAPANVWPPAGTGAHGWAKGWKDAPVVVEGPAPWKAWDGQPSSLYQLGALVTYQGKTWRATAGNNHWQPGVYGWVVV